MNISAQGSSGMFAECPHCHASIPHGFQVCNQCGYTVSAKEQQEVRNILKKNFAAFSLISLVIIVTVLYLAYQYIN